MNITMTREAVMAKLQEQLKIAQAEDVKALKKHKADEETSLKKFKQKLREALSWDYQKLKTNRFHVGVSGPSCPYRQAERFEWAIKEVSLDTRTRSFRISPSSDLARAIHWVPERLVPKRTLC